MHQEIAREPSSGNAQLQVARVPFSAIAHQSRLFLDYQRDPASLRRFYPNAVDSPGFIDSYVEAVLSNYRTDRELLCDALAGYNAPLTDDAQALSNIRLLRDTGTVAVVTGQQAGLFTGPLYTIYKALSAIKMAESLNERNIKAVPVFWVATEDHDFEEVSETTVIDSSGFLQRVKYVPEGYVENAPVGRVELDDNIRSAIDSLMQGLPRTAFTPDLEKLLMLTWNSRTHFGDAFVKHLAQILSGFGMVFIDPLYPAIKALSAPIYENAILKADEIVECVIVRNRELIADGYHAQVEIKEDYFPLFWHNDAGERLGLRKARNGTYRIRGEKHEFETAELLQAARTEPERFSPGVMLRAVVQDYLLPTVCYFGGGAEIAYFAQNSEVYRVLGRPPTPIFHRQSFTIIESRQRKILEKHRLEFTDLFNGIESLLLKVSATETAAESARLFAEVEENVNIQLHKLDLRLSLIDPTLAESLGKRRRKMLYHIAALRKKTLLSEMRLNETASRQIKSLYSALLPNDQLQERTINVMTFANRFGADFIRSIYRSIDLEDKEHRIVYL